MLFLKSFFRKKSTKIYLIIFILIISLLLILVKYKNNYIELANNNFEGSYIQFAYFYNFNDKILKLNNIKSIKEGISYKFDYLTYYFFYDNSLIGNEIIINQNISADLKTGDNVPIDYYNKTYNFKIKNISNDYKAFDTIWVSKEIWQKLLRNDKRIVYRVDLLNWVKREKTVENIKKELNIKDDVSTFFTQKQKINFDKLAIVFDVVLIIIIVIFGIVSIISLINILIDEQKINTMYVYLGYNKHILIIINILKLLLLLVLASILSVLIYGIFSLIFS